jgi:hypothetical protein
MGAPKKVHTEEVELRGHIIDSWVLPRVFDAVMDLGGEFEVARDPGRQAEGRDEPRAPARSRRRPPRSSPRS